MAKRRLELTREQILANRRTVSGLDRRLPASDAALRAAATAGLQDSMPRAALLSIHARVAGTEPTTWEHPALVQVWGPRFSAYVVAEEDRALFTVARSPDDTSTRNDYHELADRIEAFLEGRRMDCREAARGIGRGPGSMRYATLTGRVVIRWDGARQPTIWTVPRPDIEPEAARRELARRYLHVFGPTTPEAFAEWAGISPARGRATFAALADALAPVATPIGERWILAEDEPAVVAAGRRSEAQAAVRLLPSGDTYFLLQGADRQLLLPDADQRAALWTSRVWPGAVLVDGEVAGTWRRAGANVAVQAWRPLLPAARAEVEREAMSFPLAGLEGKLKVRWEG